MKSTNYLYGILPEELENKMYFEGLVYKREAGVKLCRELFLKHNKTEEDYDRMFFVNKSVEHTEKLLEERTAGHHNKHKY